MKSDEKRKIATKDIIWNGRKFTYHGPEISDERRFARHLAHQSADEKREKGRVDILCPKCGRHPVVEESEFRLNVNCPCGFVSVHEIIF